MTRRGFVLPPALVTIGKDVRGASQIVSRIRLQCKNGKSNQLTFGELDEMLLVGTIARCADAYHWLFLLNISGGASQIVSSIHTKCQRYIKHTRTCEQRESTAFVRGCIHTATGSRFLDRNAATVSTSAAEGK